MGIQGWDVVRFRQEHSFLIAFQLPMPLLKKKGSTTSLLDTPDLNISMEIEGTGGIKINHQKTN